MKLTDQLDKLYSQKQPFVIYRLPNTEIIHLVIQKNSRLFKTVDYSEDGYVFAPYHNRKSAILFPENQTYQETFNVTHKDVRHSEDHVENSQSEKSTHEVIVAQAIKQINKGILKKVVVTRCKEKALKSVEITSIFKNLEAKYKNACCYCWFHPKVGLWLGATPERFLSLNYKTLQTMSLAGTQSYKPNSSIVWSNKELEEQQIVTNFIAEKLLKVTENIEIDETKTVRAGMLVHLQTKIQASITEDVTLKSLIDTLHPTPAVCGMPREDAQKFISTFEDYDREYYTGFFGKISDSSRSASLFVNLRCMQLKKQTALIYVGGGITSDSIPEKEFLETSKKAQTLLSILK